MGLPKEVQNLSDLFSSLPSIGPKLSNRLALFLSVNGKSLASKLSHSLDEVVKSIRLCSNCSNITDTDFCEICTDSSRDRSIVIVVEDSLDLYNLEQTGEYKGMYQVLGGLISPINGIGPRDIKIDQLLNRLQDGEIKEIILALNPNLEGDSTGLYIKNEIDKLGLDIKLTRLAKGIPAGSDIEFASSQTLIDSFNSRVSF